MGGCEACADLANRGTPTPLTELRCCLFLEACLQRNSGAMTSTEELIRQLLWAIRRKLEAGELD